MRSDWIQTYSGKQFFPLSPRLQDIDIVDIAHALSHLCRYGGHTHQFYSVAEHSVLMSYRISEENAKWSLMHDSAEAYMVDVPRPIKRMIPEYGEMEDALLQTIAHRFGLPTSLEWTHVFPDEVAEADTRMLLTERKVLLPNTTHVWGEIEHLVPYPVTIVGWPPVLAKKKFLQRVAELGIN